MKKVHRKVLFIVILGITFLIIIITFKIVNIMFSIPVLKYSMEKEFNDDKSMLIDIVDYFGTQGYHRIIKNSSDEKNELFIRRSDEDMGETIFISDEIIVEHFMYLFNKCDYNLVKKYNNGIYFQRYTNRDYGCGVVYSIDGDRPQNEYLTKLEPLNEKNWYFYEEE